MIQDKFGQMIFDEQDLSNLVLQGRDVVALKNILVDQSVDLERANQFLNQLPNFVVYKDSNVSLKDWDSANQQCWHMPLEYQELDIAQYVLNLCHTESELQRCGKELLLYQERNLFDLLRYLKYLVDIMNKNNIIWGVGRGSSVASFVLYKIGIHKIDSMYYELDVEEFLR